MCELTPKISCTMTRPARGALGGAARYPASRWPSSAVRVMVTPMASSSLSALSTDPWRIGPRNPLDNPPPVRHFLPTLRSRGDQMAQHRDVSTRLPRRKFLTGLATVAAAAGTHELAFPAVVRAQEPIRIGQLIPFTGFLGAIGEYGKQGATLGVEELNEKGGVLGRKVELITEDEANPGVAVQKARKLIEKDKVVAIEGLVSSASCLAVGDEVQRARVLMINAGANSDEIRSKRCHRYVFSTEGCNTQYVSAIGNWLIRERKISRWYFLTSDYAFGHDLLRVARNLLMANKGTEVGSDLAPTGTTDLSQYLTKITAATRYVKRWGRPPDNQAYGDYVAVHAIAQAIEKAKSTDSAKLVQALEGHTLTAAMDGLKGRPLTFRAWDHQLLQPMYVVAARDKSKWRDKWDIFEVISEVPLPGESLETIAIPKAESQCQLEPLA